MTANQEWKKHKESGGTLTFAEWIDHSKQVYKATGNGSIPVNKPFSEGIQQTLESIHKNDSYKATGSGSTPGSRPMSDSIQTTLDSLHRQAGYKDDFSKEYILGIPKNIFIITTVVVVITITGVIIYKYK